MEQFCASWVQMVCWTLDKLSAKCRSQCSSRQWFMIWSIKFRFGHSIWICVVLKHYFTGSNKSVLLYNFPEPISKFFFARNSNLHPPCFISIVREGATSQALIVFLNFNVYNTRCGVSGPWPFVIRRLISFRPMLLTHCQSLGASAALKSLINEDLFMGKIPVGS